MAAARPLSKFRQIRCDWDAAKVENVTVTANRGKEFIFLMPFSTKPYLFFLDRHLFGVCVFFSGE